MKAYLLAAGAGSRLRPLTDRVPKCLVPIHGAPLLEIWLKLFEKYEISEVLINTHHLAGQVERFVAEAGGRFALKIRLTHEKQLLGSAGTVLSNRQFTADGADFLIAYADNLTDLNIARMAVFHAAARRKGGLLTMGLVRVPDPTACGIAVPDKDGRIRRFMEKPKEPEGDLANAGVYMASGRLMDMLESLAPDGGGIFDFGFHVLPALTGRMFGYPIPEYLRDIGTPAALEAAQKEWPGRAGGAPS